MAEGRLTRLSTLVWSWVAYWLVLAAVKLGPAVAAIVKASGPSGTGSVNASFGDGGISLTVVQQAATIYHASIGFLPLALWIGVPPLLLCGAWAWQRRRERKDAMRSSPV